MASEDYIKLVEARARQELEQLSSAQQRAIIEAYNTAGKELARKYQTTKGPATKALYASYTRKIATETQSIVEQYAIKGARVAPSVERLVMQQAFKMAGLDTSLANDKFENMIGTLGMESVKNVIGGKIYKDGAGLSTRIWGVAAKSGNRVQEVIAAGLAQNMSAVELSKMVGWYVNLGVRKTWDNEKIKSILGEGYAAWNKNLEYNALRLARTTLSHTATMSMRQAKRINPYLTKIRWHSVHAAGRTCPICEEMDGKVFPTEECPFDHPNGLCYQTHEMDKSLDEIADELAAWCNGEENEMLDSWWKSMGGTDEKPKPAVKPTVSKPAPAKSEPAKPKPYQETRTTTSTASKPAAKPASSTRTSGRSAYLKNANSVYSSQQKQLSEFIESQSDWRKRGLDMLTDTKVKSVTSGNGGSYFVPSQNTVYMRLGKSAAVKDNPFRSFLHESGHAVDYKLGIFSTSKEFTSAMEKDMKALLSRDKGDLIVDIMRYPSTQIQGVQDMLSSVGIRAPNKDGFVISHSKEYWDSSPHTKNKELFAHVFESSANPGQEAVMKKYFPNAFNAVVKKLGGQ